MIGLNGFNEEYMRCINCMRFYYNFKLPYCNVKGFLINEYGYCEKFKFKDEKMEQRYKKLLNEEYGNNGN